MTTENTNTAKEFVKTVAASDPKAKKSKKAKKAAKKVVAIKSAAGPRGHAYKIVKKSALPEKLSVQGSFIVGYLETHGSATKAQIAAAAAKAPKQFPCTQPHDRAVGFYLSKFKQIGALDFAKEPKAATAA